jgi:hypothetical protein
MTRTVAAKRSVKPSRPAYVLDEQIGFILRQVWQRHAAIFAREIGVNLTSPQWAVLSKLAETGACSQNQLGRLTAMDVATIKGVIDRLTAVCSSASPAPASRSPRKPHRTRSRSLGRRSRRSMRGSAKR